MDLSFYDMHKPTVPSSASWCGTEDRVADWGVGDLGLNPHIFQESLLGDLGSLTNRVVLLRKWRMGE